MRKFLKISFFSVFSILFTISLYGEEDRPASSPDKLIVARNILTPPQIDGKPDDDCWKDIRYRNIIIPADSNIKVQLKICRDKERMYMLVRFPAEKEERKHRQWHWDLAKQAYVSGDETEATFTALWTHDHMNFNKGDLWVWRAARTDPAGFADDFYCYRRSFEPPRVSKLQNLCYIPDFGINCWFSKYFSKFEEVPLPRFYQREPTGSSADVRARGRWEKGFWTIEFSRKMLTGHDDDIAFKGGETLYLKLRLRLPNVIVNDFRLFSPVFFSSNSSEINK